MCCLTLDYTTGKALGPCAVRIPHPQPYDLCLKNLEHEVILLYLVIMKYSRRAMIPWLLIIASILLSILIMATPSIWNDVVLDSKEHGVSCSDMPEYEEVVTFIENRQHTVERIESVNPGFTFVHAQRNEHTCTNKGFITITYGSHQDRIQIEQIVRDTDIQTLPVTWINR